MLLPEARLDQLLEQLGALPAGDRKAILAHLSSSERRLLRVRMRGALVLDRPVSPFSRDIAERIAAGKSAPMTDAGKAALARAVQADNCTAYPAASASGSLIDVLASRFWPGRWA